MLYCMFVDVGAPFRNKSHDFKGYSWCMPKQSYYHHYYYVVIWSFFSSSYGTTLATLKYPQGCYINVELIHIILIRYFFMTLICNILATNLSRDQIFHFTKLKLYMVNRCINTI